mmetsp:Transcript_23147/g.42612  ORF Transcript_23147/g.42612 Transcript_23147/m.42612 type:complete len:211 (+) Transcript_23147:1073-1705(+)
MMCTIMPLVLVQPCISMKNVEVLVTCQDQCFQILPGADLCSVDVIRRHSILYHRVKELLLMVALYAHSRCEVVIRPVPGPCAAKRAVLQQGNAGLADLHLHIQGSVEGCLCSIAMHTQNAFVESRRGGMRDLQIHPHRLRHRLRDFHPSLGNRQERVCKPTVGAFIPLRLPCVHIANLKEFWCWQGGSIYAERMQEMDLHICQLCANIME